MVTYLAGIAYLLIGSIWTIPWWQSAALDYRTGGRVPCVVGLAAIGGLAVCTLWPLIPIGYVVIAAWRAWA